MSLLTNLSSLVSTEFKDVLPALNAVVQDMTTNYSAWQSNPVVKSTEAVTQLVNPVAAIDLQAVIGAASLVQALWQVFGTQPTTPVAVVTPSPEPVPVMAEPAVVQSIPTPTLQEQIINSGGSIP